MRHLPKFHYNGLTLVLSNPSRFDNTKKQLLSGYTGIFINDKCLRPKFNRWQCDIRTSDTLGEGLLDGTRVILLLGEHAMQEWTGGDLYKDNTLHEQRGYLLNSPLFFNDKANDLYILASYYPQDCMDIIDFEAKLNPLAAEGLDDIRLQESDEASEKKRHGKTLRSNFRFWLQRDIKKALWFLTHTKDEINKTSSTRLAKYEIYPASELAIKELNSNKNKKLFLDIETDPDYNITCFSFAFTLDRIFTVPIYRFDYHLAYTKQTLFEIIRGLVIAMRDNEIVCHNSMFDLMILAVKYKLPIGRRIYDTMLAHHRCWPEAEKSLGHAISHLCMLESYHKDEGIFQPRNRDQELQLWNYNARDVSSMILVHNSLEAYSKEVPGLKDSIAQANDMVYPYLVATIQGITFDDDKRTKMLVENDRLMTQYLRIIKILVGEEILPTSNKQCNEYFHKAMGYATTLRSKKGNPSWNELALRKLKLKIMDNPVIDFMLRFRAVSKESGTLKFQEWERKLEQEEDERITV